MATEKTSLLHNNLMLQDKVKESIVVVTIPKQMTDDDDAEIWSGLTRSQLMAYVDDPYWITLRKVLMIAFWVSLFAMFMSAIVIASVEHNGICVPKLKMMNLQKGIANVQAPLDLMNKLSISNDKSNLTNGLVS